MRRVELSARVWPEHHFVVDRQVPVDPTADPRVFVCIVCVTGRTVLPIVHDVVSVKKQQRETILSIP